MIRWFAFGIAAALAVALATHTGATGYNMTLAAVVVAIGALVAVAVQVQKPFYGMAALVLSATAFPLHIAADGQVNAPLGLAALVSVCWLFRELFVMRRLELTATPVVGIVVALMVSAVTSFFAGQIDWYTVPGAATHAQVGGLAIFLLSGGLMLAVGHQIRSVHELRLMTYMFLAAGGVVTLLVLSPSFDVVAAPTVHPATIGSVFWTWLAGIGAAQACFNRELSPLTRLGVMLIVFTALFNFLFQHRDWVSGWAPPLMAILLVFAVRFPRIAFCACLAALPGLFLTVHKMFNSLMAHESYSLYTRLDAWSTVLKIIEKSPIFGVGPSNYYHYAQLYSTHGWYVKMSSHNNYLDIAAQTGLVGLLLFLSLGVAAAALLWRLKKQALGAFEHAYVVGCLGSLAASFASGMLADWVIPFIYNIGLAGFRSSVLFWVFLGGALALWRMQNSQDDAPAREVERTYQLPSPLLLESGFGPLELEPPH